MIGDLSPGLILILGALLVPVLRGHLRSVWILALPAIALLHLLSLPAGEFGRFEMMGMTLTTLRVDELSVAFAGIFLVAIFLGLVYALHLNDPVQHVAALIYAGSAVGAVMAGDLVTLFIFWEGTAVASVFLIWASRSERAYRAGMRYLIIQVASGLLLLEGLLVLYHDTHDIGFGAIELDGIGSWMILIAFGIKAGFPLLHAWLPDAYPEATPTGTVILSAFTTKLAIYALARGFPGTEILIPVGLVMVVFPLFLAAVADDLRRMLAYVLISQVGFMVVGVGIGTELALAGVASHAVAHIVYKSLLFMVAGAILLRAGTAAASQLGGIYRAMPWTARFAVIGAASIAAPLFCGFVGKALILSAALAEGYVWTWLILVAGGVGAFVLAGLRPLQIVFSSEGAAAPAMPVAEAPANMLLAMGLAAALSLAIGVFPSAFYGLMPYGAGYEPYALSYVVSQLQLLAFATLAFVLLVRRGLVPRGGAGINLDFDWTYRRGVMGGAAALYDGAVRTRAAVLGAAGRKLSAFLDRLYRHHGPEGILARNWPTGAMAFWTTVLLAVWLLAYLI